MKIIKELFRIIFRLYAVSAMVLFPVVLLALSNDKFRKFFWSVIRMLRQGIEAVGSLW
ncbi:MAG: hypothetical protein K0R63_974 [Rickettsiales bacterium]|jgi:hypothetical protein|nr:hypothetical protein [Rickettsiales bacterium]